jgi:hypothetical protein
LGDERQRQAIYAPTYGFGMICAPHLAPKTSLALVDPSHSDPSGFVDLRMPFDTVNLGALEYVLYPHLITHLGELPASWTPSAATADYVAVWEQTNYRSAREQEAARRSEYILRTAVPGRAACVYADARGDHGVVFAVSARAQAALAHVPARQHVGSPVRADAVTASAPAAPAGLESGIVAYMLGLLGVATLWLIGLLAQLVLPRRAVAWPLLAVLAFPLGCLSVGFELVVLSLLGVPWSRPALAVPWVGLTALALWRRRAIFSAALRRDAWRRTRHLGQALGRAKLAADEKIALVLLGAITSVTGLLALLELPELDGFAFTYFKARAFFIDGSITPYYQHSGTGGTLLFSEPGHPPLASMPVVWLYLWLGRIDERVTLLLWPAFLVVLLAGFYVLARSAVSRRLALWTTLGFALIGWPGKIILTEDPWLRADTIITSPLAVGWIDLPLAVFLLLGCGLLWRWIASERASSWPLLVAGILLGGAAWTKEEGLTAALFALAATLALLLWSQTRSTSEARPRGRNVWCSLAWCAVGLTASIVPWLLIRARYPVPDFRVQVSPGVFLHLLAYSAVEFARRAILYWLAPLLVVGVAALRRWQGRDRSTSLLSRQALLLGFVVLAQAAVDVVAIAAVAGSVGGAQSEMVGAGTRLLYQLQALVYLGTLELWPGLCAEAEAGQPAEPATVPAMEAVAADEDAS